MAKTIPTLPGEIWKPYPNDTSYYVSDRGRVWSWKRGGKFLTSHLSEDGYALVGLTIGRRVKTRPIHQLVLETFIGARPIGKQACHADGDKNNNTPANLRWDTCANNNADKKRHGTWHDGPRNPRAKLTEAQVVEIRMRSKAGEQGRALAREFGVADSTVYDIIRRKNWRVLPERDTILAECRKAIGL